MRLLLSNCDKSRPIDRNFPHREERNSDGRQMAVAISNGNRVYLIVERLAKKFDLYLGRTCNAKVHLVFKERKKRTIKLLQEILKLRDFEFFKGEF